MSQVKMNVASLFGIPHVVGKDETVTLILFYSLLKEGDLEPEALHGSSVTDSVK